jgi:hypothetical protein
MRSLESQFSEAPTQTAEDWKARLNQVWSMVEHAQRRHQALEVAMRSVEGATRRSEQHLAVAAQSCRTSEEAEKRAMQACLDAENLVDYTYARARERARQMTVQRLSEEHALRKRHSHLAKQRFLDEQRLADEPAVLRHHAEHAKQHFLEMEEEAAMQRLADEAAVRRHHADHAEHMHGDEGADEPAVRRHHAEHEKQQRLKDKAALQRLIDGPAIRRHNAEDAKDPFHGMPDVGGRGEVRREMPWEHDPEARALIRETNDELERLKNIRKQYRDEEKRLEVLRREELHRDREAMDLEPHRRTRGDFVPRESDTSRRSTLDDITSWREVRPVRHEEERTSEFEVDRPGRRGDFFREEAPRGDLDRLQPPERQFDRHELVFNRQELPFGRQRRE